MDTVKNTWRNRRSVIFLSLILIILIILLLFVLLARAFLLRDDGSDIVGQVTATVVVTDALSPNQEATPTATATRVVQGGTPTATTEGDTTGTPDSSTGSTTTPTPGSSTSSTSSEGDNNTTSSSNTNTAVQSQPVQVIQNGGFEGGFSQDGVANGWQSFNNGGAGFIFAPEVWPLAIHNGNQAQRITIHNPQAEERYAGIYQTFNVVPGEPYILTLHGQIRTSFGDVQASNYGYRLQYAVDWLGGTNSQAISPEAWLDLPWGEQLLDSADVQFSQYSAQITPSSERLTLFIRAVYKWPTPGEAQYTLDSISFNGPGAN